MNTDIQKKAYKIVYLQLTGVALLAALTLLFSDLQTSLSVFFGGMAFGLSNLLFAWVIFKFIKEIHLFLIAFFIGEMLKLGFSSVLFLLIVLYLPVSLLPTLMGFIGAIVSFWITGIWTCMCESRLYSKES